MLLEERILKYLKFDENIGICFIYNLKRLA